MPHECRSSEGRRAVDLQGPDLLFLRGGLQAEVRPRAGKISRRRLESDGYRREMIEPPLLRGRDRYERVTTGRTDNTHDDAFTHTVRLEDPERAIEVEIVATPSVTEVASSPRSGSAGRGAGRGRRDRGGAPG